MNIPENDYLFKFLLIGAKATGKTNILYRFSKNVFNSTYLPTIGLDFSTRSIKVLGKMCKIMLWDTAGNKRFKAISQSYYKGSQGILLVFNVADASSFKEVDAFFDEYKRYADSKKSILVLIGNFCDMETARVISYQKAADKAMELGVPYLEVSAKTGHNIEDLFVMLSKMIIETGVAPPVPPLPKVASSPLTKGVLLSAKRSWGPKNMIKQEEEPTQKQNFLIKHLRSIGKTVATVGAKASLLAGSIFQAKSTEKTEYKGNLTNN